MKKVQAGGIIRESLDNTWQTPPEILDPVRVYHGGEIPLDPATSSDNPTQGLELGGHGIAPVGGEGGPC